MTPPLVGPPIAPQKLPLVTEPVIVRVAGSTLTPAAVEPISLSEVRISIVAGESSGYVNRPEPVRTVEVSSVLTPEASLAW